MKAIQIKQTGGPEVLEYVDLPTPTAKANEAVVKTTAIGVNFIDVYNREGRYKVPLPFVPGQEAAGIVEAVGKDVTTLKPGDRVAYASMLGSYAEYACVAADRLVKVPDGVDDRQAAAVMLQEGGTVHGHVAIHPKGSDRSEIPTERRLALTPSHALKAVAQG